ncbi:hypothetical protein ROHU_017540 [Labeo rohita]|uniref:Uncharacterized protein n=1 Tax=Labeo rohita TaxID=84645 RepID=A0A498NDW2_LABRO|nr:hypothetical protein ROHU_017540 [Labeo rohita]
MPAAHPRPSPDSDSAAKDPIFTSAAMTCHAALSINAYLAGFSSTHSVSRNRLKLTDHEDGAHWHGNLLHNPPAKAQSTNL